MSRLWIPLVLLASPLAAQAPVRAGAGDAAPGVAVSLDSVAPLRVRLGLKPVAPPFAIGFPDTPGLRALWLRPRFTDWVAQWTRQAQRTAAERRRQLWRAGLPGAPSPDGARPARAQAPSDTVEYLPRLVQEDTAQGGIVPGALGQYADIGMRIEGRGELGGAWSRFEPCDPGALFGACNPSLFPQLKPDMQFGVQVVGTVSDRVHVNVDYDQRREFDAKNNINVYYEGLEDEILQRLEVGDVSIRLPASRYITQGIPSGNFGFKATGQLGPLDFQAVWAQQKGDLSTREFKLGGGGSGGLVQDAEVVLDDADYVKGQFFFVVDPNRLTGAPHIDILRLRDTDSPAQLRPARNAATPIQLYRDERVGLGPQTQGQSLFQAEAVSADGSLRHGGRFRRLIEGEDYHLDGRSGLWLVLRQPLRQDEALAVAYVAASGDTIGTYNADAVQGSTPPTLHLLRGPAAIHQPGTATWDYEMHQVYRLDSSSGVERSSVGLAISLGELTGGLTYRDHAGQQLPFLKLFGLDEDSPSEKLDDARLYQPAREAASGLDAARITGTYIVFPTLRPFGTPPPVPSARLTAEDTRLLLAADTNRTIYAEPDPVRRDAGGRFRLNFDYRVRMEGLVSSFNLGAIGLRPESEKITVDGRQLLAGQDYDIDYDLGMVTLKDPQSIFGTNPNAEIRATWEQQPLFALAPTSVFGMNARYELGTRGELNFMGLYQAEQTIMTRPQLGTEPGSIFLGGMSGRVDVGAGWLDRALSALPALRRSGESAIDLTGELALSLPNPNTGGHTYVDDFESTDDVPVELLRQFWRLGSRPETLDGAAGVLPAFLGVETAAPLVWQHDFLKPDGSIGGPVFPHEIDTAIRTAGSPRPDQHVLWVSLGDEATPPNENRWRSITTVLSPTGRDMTRSEFLEFYAAADERTSLVIDIGTVGEDAFYFDAEGRTSGVTQDGRRWGLGLLDEEAQTAKSEIWSTQLDQRGLWDHGTACRAEGGYQTYTISDPRANCTAANGRLDSEDLDGNGAAELGDGPLFRYVVRLSPQSPYRVREPGPGGTGTIFALYRIPLRAEDAVELNGAGPGAWRYVKHLRVTFTGPTGRSESDLGITRMRIIGSRWAKRGTDGIQRGLTSQDPGTSAGTAFQVGPASRLTDGGAYEPPPGIGDQLLDPSQQFGVGGGEFNEKSLRLGYENLAPGDRAEVYYRYPQQPRSFLSYRELRLWAVSRGGAAADERLVVKVGTDPQNFYLFQTPVPRAAGGNVKTGDWEEVIIDFRRWFDLKAEAEQALITMERQGREPVVLWSADSAYAIVLQDRALAPNLAAVREIGFAAYNGGQSAGTGEIWIDDMRLGGAVTDPGFAGNLNLDVRAGDFLSASVGYSDRGPLFRQLNQDADYQSSGDLRLTTTAQLGQFAPSGWGLEMPLTVSHARTGLEPTFLARSDVTADKLQGLRETGGSSTRFGIALRKRTPSANEWVGLLVDGLSLRAGWQNAENTSVTARSAAEGFDGAVAYARDIDVHELDITPGFFEAAMRALVPKVMEESDAFQRLVGAELRWSPEHISLSTSYANQESRAFRYDRILELPSDTAVAPTISPRQGLQNDARVAFRPFASLTAEVALTSTRDLLPPDRATDLEAAREAIAAARSDLAGLGIGWETDRSLSTQIGFRPELTSWLRPGFRFSGRFSTVRNPSYLEQIAAPDGDSTTVLQRDFDGSRQVTRSLLLEPGGLIQAAFGGTASKDGALGGKLLWHLSQTLQPLDLSWNNGINSRFERELGLPGVGYQFGLGDVAAFRFAGEDSATAAVERNAFRARGGLRLPFSTTLDVSFENAASSTFGSRGGTTSDSRTWPDVRLSWNAIPLPEKLKAVVTRAQISTGYTTREETSVYNGGGERSSRQSSIPLSLNLGLGRVLTASYTGSLTTGDGTDPTGGTERQASSHTVQLGGTFNAPGQLRERFQHPIQAMLRFSQTQQDDCRARPVVGQEPDTEVQCVKYIDTVNRTVNMTIDTVVRDLTLGFQMSYTDRLSDVGTRAGSSNFQLGLFGQFNFTAGNFGRLGR